MSKLINDPRHESTVVTIELAEVGRQLEQVKAAHRRCPTTRSLSWLRQMEKRREAIAAYGALLTAG